MSNEQFEPRRGEILIARKIHVKITPPRSDVKKIFPVARGGDGGGGRSLVQFRKLDWMQ